MIAIDIPMPENCRGCLFRDGRYECRIKGEIRPNSFTRDMNCPLLRVETIKARLLTNIDERSKIEIGKIIGEGLAKKGAIQFHVGMRERTVNPDGDLLRYFSPELTGEMPMILPKGV